MRGLSRRFQRCKNPSDSLAIPVWLVRNHDYPRQPNGRCTTDAPCDSVNVDALAKAESEKARDVLARMEDRGRTKRLAAQAAVEAAMVPDLRPRQRHHPHGGHHRRKRSSAASGSFPTAEPSPLKKAQLLRKENNLASAATRGVGDTSSAGGGVQSLERVRGVNGSEAVVGGAAEDERSVGEGKGSTSRGLARNVALQEIVGPIRSDSCSEWTG